MNINEILELPDGTSIENVTLTFNSVNDPKPKSPNNPSWGKEWFAQCFDATGKIGVIICLKKDEYDPVSFKGKTVQFTSGKNADKQNVGIKTKKNKAGTYLNIYITDAAKPKILDGHQQAAPSSTSSTSRTSESNHRASFPAQLLPVDDLAKHLAAEWVHVYDLVAPIFETRLTTEQLPERVTSIIMGLKRDFHIQNILPIPEKKVDWKNYVIQGTKLGDLPLEKLRNGYVKSLQGAFKNPDTVAAFTSAFKEMELGHSSVYGHWLVKEGIDDDTSEELLKLKYSSLEAITDEDYRKILSDPEFFEEAKRIQAAKKTPFDDDEATSLD